MPKRPKRIPEVDSLVSERIRWLEREIAEREVSIAETEARLAKTKGEQVEARAERARLLAFLPNVFEERARLIELLLAKEGLEVREDMTREERAELDVERQALVLRLGANNWPLKDLRRSVGEEVEE